MDKHHRELKLLDELTEYRANGLCRKKDEYLTSLFKNASYEQTEEFRTSHWAENWAFHVPAHFASCLDIELAVRTKTEKLLDKNGKPIPVVDENGTPVYTKTGLPAYKKKKNIFMNWAQGSAFDFSEGSVFYDSPDACALVWRDALQRINVMLKILESTPAVPAQTIKNKKGVKLPPDEWVVRHRDPGEIKFSIYQPNDGRTALEFQRTMTVTADEFVKILICGLPQGWREYERHSEKSDRSS